MDIVLDFDGTCVTHSFPELGKDIGAIPVLHKLIKCGHNLILFTMRSNVKEIVSYSIENPEIYSGNYLDEAVKWFSDNNITLYGIQVNPTQHTWTNSPKAYGQLIIDDAALGAPLIYNPSISSRPYIDWIKVEYELYRAGILF